MHRKVKTEERERECIIPLVYRHFLRPIVVSFIHLTIVSIRDRVIMRESAFAQVDQRIIGHRNTEIELAHVCI